MNQKHTLDISWQSFFRFFAVLGGIVLAIYIRQVILALMMALVCAAIFEKPIRFLEKHHLHRLVGTLLIYCLAFIILGFLFYLLAPSVWDNLNRLYNLLPLENINSDWIRLFSSSDWLAKLPHNLNEFFSRFSDLNIAFSGLFQFLSHIFGGLLYTLLIIFFSFYINVDKGGIEYLIRFFSPKGYEGYVLNLWHRFENLMGRWFYSQLASSFVMALIIFSGLLILKVPSAFLLAFLALILNFIPYLGAILSLIIALILASEKGLMMVVFVTILYLVAQEIEHVIGPFIRGKILRLSPFAIILVVVIGGMLGGILGVLLALPLLILLFEIVKDIKSGKLESFNPQQKLI